MWWADAGLGAATCINGRIKFQSGIDVYRSGADDLVCQSAEKLETFSVAIAVLVTLFAAGHMELSVIVIVAASLSATLATVLLRVTQKGAK